MLRTLGSKARAGVVLSGLFLALWQSDSARAQATDPPAKDEAVALFESAVALYREGDYRAALFTFEKAYDLAPNFRLLYNIGLCHRALHDYAKAHLALSGYLEQGAAEIGEERAAAVRKEVDTLEGRVARIDIHVEQEGVLIFVDGQERGRSPLEGPLLVNLGNHTIRLEKEGFEPARGTVESLPGETSRFSFSLEPRQPVPEAQSVSPPPAEKPAPSPKRSEPEISAGLGAGFWVSTAIAGAAVVGASVSGGLALASKTRISDKKNQLPYPEEAIAKEEDRRRRRAITADVMVGLAVAAGGAALYFGLTSKHKHADKKASRDLSLGVGAGGVVLQGAFP